MIVKVIKTSALYKKSKITKRLNSEENQTVPNHITKPNDKTHKKRMDKNCHVPDLVQVSVLCNDTCKIVS